MRAMISLPISLVLLGLAGPAVGQSAALPALPELTPEQRWERAALHVTLFAALALWEGLQQGETVDAIAGRMADLVGGWRGTDTPLAMARSIRNNWMLWPDAEWELEEASDDRVRFRMSRPWTDTFGENGLVFGVSETDFTAWLRLFHEGIAAGNGMTYRQVQDGADLRVTITRP